ncbi:MAG: hypothetical protein WD426_04800 [Anditalea sp.]
MDNIQPISIYQKYAEDLDKNLSIFWIGFVVYSLGDALSATYATGMIKVIQLFQAIGLLSIVYATFHIVQFNSKNDFVKISLVLYFSWVIFVLFHGFVYEYDFVKRLFFSGLFKYFFPLIIFFPKNLDFYKKAFSVIVALNIAFIILNVFFVEIVLAHYDQNVVQKFTFEGFAKTLGAPAGFLIFTYIYHSKNRNLLALLVVITIILIATYKARRAIMVFSSLNLLIFMAIFYIKSNKKILMAVCMIIFLSVIGVVGEKIYRENRDTFFEQILERGAEDTRTGVEVAFSRDFDTIDWIIGRGINGMYWCPNVDMGDTTGYRTMIETDYLNIILKGGIIHLGLILLIAFPAAIKGLFFSRNLLSKAAGIWIIIWILSLYPLNVFNTDFNYMLFWICVCIGYSKDLRNMPDATIKKAFSSK